MFSTEGEEDVLRQSVVAEHNVTDYSKIAQCFRYVCGMQNGADP
jgi:hypothetical protein